MSLLGLTSGNLLKSLLQRTTCLSPTTTLSHILGVQDVRNKNYWADYRMLKDYNKRQTVIKHSAERIRINTIRKNDILPREIREIADEEIKKEPPYSNYICLVPRCVVTSRAKGTTVKRWRVSRIIFRHLADYNKLSGVQRGIW